jgi:hypothetical protein
MLIVRWLFTHSAYVILCGDSLLDIDGKRFFLSMKELNDSLYPKGLTVKNKEVVRLDERAGG